MAVIDPYVGIKQRRIKRRRGRRVRQLLLVAGVVAFAAGLIGGAIVLQGMLVGASPAVIAASTTTTAGPPAGSGYAIVPSSGDTAASKAVTATEATTTFKAKLPEHATGVLHAGDSRGEQLTFTLGKAHAIIVSQPIIHGMPLYRWLTLASAGGTISPISLGGHSGYLQRQTSHGKTVLIGSFVQGALVYTAELYGPAGQQARMLGQLKTVAAAIKPHVA